MPFVNEQQPIDRPFTIFRVHQLPRKILRLQRSPHPVPSLVQRIQECLRRFDRRTLRIRQLRPNTFLIRFYRRLILSQRQLQSHVGIHMAVRYVMYQLPHRPPAFAIRRIQLRVIQPAHRLPQILRRRGNRRYRLLPFRAGNLLRHFHLPNRVSRIHSLSPPQVSASTLRLQPAKHTLPNFQSCVSKSGNHQPQNPLQFGSHKPQHQIVRYNEPLCAIVSAGHVRESNRSNENV